MNWKPGNFFSTYPSNTPAIEWWRHGFAVAGERSVVFEAREYTDEAARYEALLDYQKRQEGGRR